MKRVCEVSGLFPAILPPSRPFGPIDTYIKWLAGTVFLNNLFFIYNSTFGDTLRKLGVSSRTSSL